MLEYLKKEANMTFTENGAVTYGTTGSECLDLFATVGALRGQSDDEIIRRFVRAFTEDRDTAMKLLFFARDIRGGLGERRVFRTVIKWLAENEPDTVRKNLGYIAEYGRFDDLLSLMGTELEKDMIDVVKRQLDADLEALEKRREYLPARQVAPLRERVQCPDEHAWKEDGESAWIFRGAVQKGTVLSSRGNTHH